LSSKQIVQVVSFHIRWSPLSKTDLKAELYWNKDEGYSSNIRWDIIQLIPAGNHKILEVGCGAGHTLKKLKELGKAKETVGIEINEQVTRELSHTLDRLYVGDVETVDLPPTENCFDYILFGDVLEHLIDPRGVLHSYKSLLRYDGYIIASIPNIKHYSVLLRLIFFDEFQYTDAGILDRSHLRFFTKKEILKMFTDEKFEVVDLIPVDGSKPGKRYKDTLFTFLNSKLFAHLSSLQILTMYFLDSSFYAAQYIIKAKKTESEKAAITTHL
jgi:2-polyprenyl-3-methyl-5-hydroxy-6-metoxy-1,4-benzoquinol methylase